MAETKSYEKMMQLIEVYQYFSN